METYYFIYNKGFVLVRGDYTFNPDIMDNLGTTLDDYNEGKYVLLNEEQTSFLKSNAGITPEEAWDMSFDVYVKEGDINALIADILDYDSSSDVNVFYVNDIPVWFNKETRISLGNSISIEKEIGKETTILWINNTPYTMGIEEAKQMLIDLELYAISCYNNTQKNIATVKTFTLKEEIKNFDITQGYPNKLKFNLQSL